jgi:hypothetical protein
VRLLVEVALRGLDDDTDRAVHLVLPRDREAPADVAEELARRVGEVATVGGEALHALLGRDEDVPLPLGDGRIDVRGELAVQSAAELQH